MPTTTSPTTVLHAATTTIARVGAGSVPGWFWWAVGSAAALALLAMVVWNRSSPTTEHRQAMQRFVAEESAAVILACAGVATIAALSAPWNKMLIVIVILAFLAGTAAIISGLKLSIRPRPVALDKTPEEVETMEPEGEGDQEGTGDTYNVHAHGDHGTAIGKQQNFYAPRAQPQVVFQNVSRTTTTLTLAVLIDPPNTAVPYLTLFCSDRFALRGLPMVRVNWQEGITGDGRHFTGFATPAFPFTMEIEATEENPFLGFSFTPPIS